MLQSLRWIDPRYSLCIINHSDDILPSQVPFKDEHGNDFCTKINLLDKYTSEEKCKEYELRVHVIKWVVIDAYHIGYDEYIALLYGKNPQTYWHPSQDAKVDLKLLIVAIILIYCLLETINVLLLSIFNKLIIFRAS
jgi:hypothetical protein